MVYDGKGWAMKLALAQIDMRLGDIEGICGRIEDQARLAHERGARVLCVPAPLFMGASCPLRFRLRASPCSTT